MKKILWLILFLIPVLVQAEEARYPWSLTLGGGGALFCDKQGCFGPSGYAVGGSFGRHFTDRWAFELETTYAHTSELLPPRVDEFGNIFTPELQRTRVWGGGAFLATLAHMGRSEFFIEIGLALAWERQEEITPEGIFHTPTVDIGLVGGVSGGAGLNLWLGEGWGLRPEVRFYGMANSLSGLRYTAGLLKKF